VIAATHQDLEAKVRDGSFCADSLHRLDVVRLQLPPLRERKGDMPALAACFLAQAAKKLGAPAKRFHPDAPKRLQPHDWPGNVRELEDLCWRLAALAPGEAIAPRDLGNALCSSGPANVTGDWTRPLAQAVREALAREDVALHATMRERFDQVLLQTALDHTEGHRQQAAETFGLGRNAVMKKLGLVRERNTS
jgi:two-component system nitrogen regulation response regulator GlnG